MLAAADVLFDPPLLLSQHVLGLLLPVPVGRPTRLHGVRTAFKETGHPGGEEFLVGVGGDVVSGVGAVVVVGDDVAQQRGGLTAGAAARDVHPGVGVAVFVVAFAGHPLVQGPELPKLTRAAR